jgi:hypothetical protein
MASTLNGTGWLDFIRRQSNFVNGTKILGQLKQAQRAAAIGLVIAAAKNHARLRGRLVVNLALGVQLGDSPNNGRSDT